MSFFEKNWKALVGILGVLFLIGAGVTVQSVMTMANEKESQEKFFLIEKKYVDYKNKKNPQASAADKTAKKPTAEELTQEIAGIKKDFEQFISENSKSKATQMAALYYAEILKEENNTAQALQALEKVQTSDKGLVNTLVQQQIGQLLADTGKCKEAIELWQKIVDRKEAHFIHNDVKIQQALCYQSLNDLKKAEEILTNVANQKTDARAELAIKEASKYLRLIQAKKIVGT